MAISSEHVQRIFRKTERELDRLSSEKHAKAVHGFRTSARRLETLLEEIAPHRDRHRKKLLKMLSAIRRRAGRVRDLDVQLEALRSLKVPQEPRRKTQLMQSLIELRRKREARLRKLLRKQDIRDIHKRFKQAYKAFETEGARDPLAVARQMLASAITTGSSLDAEKLHRCRIAVKRARYAAELAQKSPAATRFMAELKRMQDALGNWHDWQLLTETARQRLGEVNQSSLVAVLHNVTQGKFRQAVKVVSAPETVRGTVQAMPSDAKSIKKPLPVIDEAAA
jgi:CHAD domain-containing protein